MYKEKTFEEIVAEEIQRDLDIVNESIEDLERKLLVAKSRKAKYEKQRDCDGHTFVPLGGGMEILQDVCTKCDRSFYY